MNLISINNKNKNNNKHNSQNHNSKNSKSKIIHYNNGFIPAIIILGGIIGQFWLAFIVMIIYIISVPIINFFGPKIIDRIFHDDN